MPRLSLDEILAAASDIKRRDKLDSRALAADLAKEVEQIEAENWQAPADVDYLPEQPAPMDWLLIEAFAKAKAKQGLAEEPQGDSGAWYTIEGDDT